MYTLLIVDDEPNVLIGMKALIDWESYGVMRIETATNCSDALVRAVDTHPQIALIDVCIGKEFGQDLVKRIRDSGVDCACIMMSGHREFGYAIEALGITFSSPSRPINSGRRWNILSGKSSMGLSGRRRETTPPTPLSPGRHQRCPP